MRVAKFINILYYNIFLSFHRIGEIFAGRPTDGPIHIANLDRENGKRDANDKRDDYLADKVLIDPDGSISLSIASRFLGILGVLFSSTFFNLICALVQVDIQLWKYGMFALAVVLIVLTFVVDEVLSTDFREYRSWSAVRRRKFALITLLTVIGVTLVSICSLALYLSVAIKNKH